MSSIPPGMPGGTFPERGGNGSLGSSPTDPLATAGPVGYRDPAPTTGDPHARDATRGRGHRDDTHRSEFGDFLDDLSELARGGQGDLRHEIEHRVAQARTRMSAALDQGRELSTRARAQMVRGLDQSRGAVVEHPLSSIALAAAGGLLVGLLLSRRD